MASPPPIPFNRPSVAGSELEYIADALQRGHVSGDGHYTHEAQAYLERICAAKRVLLTTSCSHALDMSAMLLGLAPGDEVIMPSFTFVSTANAVVLRGATPVFVDIRPDTLNLDERLVEAAITKRTKAIFVVHYAGIGCDMDALLATARRHGLQIVEDNAHGLFGSYKDKPLGSFGALSTLSFHETKNVTCGEGGALVLNDASLIEAAEIIREKGTNRARFFRGQVDKYTWVGLGSSYLPSDMLAAFLLAQLQSHERIQAARKTIWERYATTLGDWAANAGIGVPLVPPDREQSYHIFYLLLPHLEARTRFIDALRSRGVYAAFHYVPLHRSEMAVNIGAGDAQCPVTEEISDRLVRLPLFASMTQDEQGRVIDAVLNFEPR